MVSNKVAPNPPFKLTSLPSRFYCYITIMWFNSVVSSKSMSFLHEFMQWHSLSNYLFFKHTFIYQLESVKFLKVNICLKLSCIFCSTQLDSRHLVNIYFFKLIIMSYIPRSRSFHGEGNGNLLQYSSLENPMDRGAWQATPHGIAKSQTWLSNQYSHMF